jgi:hypothetical protein
VIKNEIFLIENLIDIDYLSLLNNWLNFSKPNYDKEQKSKLGTYNVPPNLYEGFQNLYIKVKNEIEKFYKVCLYDEHFYNIVEYKVGEMLGLHTDDGSKYLDGNLIYEAGTSTGHPSRDISTVVYFNDTYTGGEIEFPNLSIKVKPKAGTLIAFPSKGDLFQHQSLEIKSGKKWITPCFWHIKNF